MKTENRKQYRKLNRFINKLGIKSAEALSPIEELLEALEIGMFDATANFGKAEQIFMDPSTYKAFEGLSKQLDKK